MAMKRDIRLVMVFQMRRVVVGDVVKAGLVLMFSWEA